MLSVFGSAYLYEQLFSLMKDVKSRSSMHPTDVQLEECMRITTVEIQCDIDRLSKQRLFQLSH